MVNNQDHYTVDMLYNVLLAEIPTLSKTTIYNTLNLFLEKGLIKEINLDNTEARFDIMLEDHMHFICLKCKKIYDIMMNDRQKDVLKVPEHQVKETHVIMKGTCKECI